MIHSHKVKKYEQVSEAHSGRLVFYWGCDSMFRTVQRNISDAEGWVKDFIVNIISTMSKESLSKIPNYSAELLGKN